jgi:two-component system phosphate regulon sensor histidine kinase PhoR
MADLGHVWVVDDSPLDADMVQRALGKSFTVQLFSDGSSLLEAIVVKPLPDVLVLDWVMPGVSGIEVCKFLRGHEATANLSILLLTASNQTEQIVQGLAAGANDYLSKPWSPAELVARVNSLLRGKRLRERAEVAERSLRALLADLPDALITTRHGGEITFINAEAERVLRNDNSQVKGRRLSEYFPDLAAAMEADQPLPELVLNERAYAPASRKLEIGGVPVVAVTLRDVTDKRRLEQRRLDFYSMVAHDLRSPLSAMMLRVAIMQMGKFGPLPEGYVKELNLIDARVHEMIELINDFLEIARSEGVGLGLRQEKLELGQLVRDNLDDFTELAMGRQVRLELRTPPEPLMTSADPARLKQVLTNLISNAVKFSPLEGEVKIELVKKENELELSVSDHGQGITAERLPELFQRYARIDSKQPGTGLGLLIVKEIIDAHGGTCGVESTPGMGSRFWIRLPLVT